MRWHALEGTGHVAFIKGAVDGLLALSTRVWAAERPEPLTDALRLQIRATNDDLAQAGMRVLGVAFRPLAAVLPAADAGDIERDLTFLGLVGMMDPPRASGQAGRRHLQDRRHPHR